jgi:hypothetical protein
MSLIFLWIQLIAEFLPTSPKSCSKGKNKQFLFISPHDISMFEPSESVRIHPLKAPERDSTAASMKRLIV